MQAPEMYSLLHKSTNNWMLIKVLTHAWTICKSKEYNIKLVLKPILLITSPSALGGQAARGPGEVRDAPGQKVYEAAHGAHLQDDGQVPPVRCIPSDAPHITQPCLVPPLTLLPRRSFVGTSACARLFCVYPASERRTGGNTKRLRFTPM